MAQYGNNYDYGESPLYKDEGYNASIEGLYYFLPNWKYDVNLSYIFNTIISTTRQKKEQRKALYDTPLRKLSFTVTSNRDTDELFNYLKSKHASFDYIPIYTEPCKIQGTGTLQGETEFNVNDISNYYNINNITDYILLIDLVYPDNGEMIRLYNIDGNTIYLDTEIQSNFNKETSYIYPLFKCYLSNKKISLLTHAIYKIDLEYIEVIERLDTEGLSRRDPANGNFVGTPQHWNVLINSRLVIDNTGGNLLLFGQFGGTVRSYVYNSTGTSLIQRDSFNLTGVEISFAIDTRRKFLFVGTLAHRLYCLSYDSNGIITYIHFATTYSFDPEDLEIDIDNKLIIVALETEDIGIWEYTDGGMLSFKDSLDLGYNSLSCGIDTINQLAFLGNINPKSLSSYRYSSIGTITQGKDISQGTRGEDVITDFTDSKNLVFLANNNLGVSSFSCNISTYVLNLLNTVNPGGTTYAVILDIESNLAVTGSSVGIGITIYKYSSLGIFTLISNNTSYDSYKLAIDTDNRLIFSSGGTGITIYRYE